ncbi:MAG: MmcQ/YjbR family DNA-binding protein [Myxococcales bacterium]|nr:MmcQ/YjbR family DNA-binding protein [Myxococcales bacterium]
MPEAPGAAAVQAFALSLPEAWEDYPWGERAFKVRKKVFCFFSGYEGRVRVSVKLPDSAPFLVQEPFASPTGYGLGKSGWVTCAFPEGQPLPVDRISAWIDESYRAVAPKALVKTLGPPLEDPA